MSFFILKHPQTVPFHLQCYSADPTPPLQQDFIRCLYFCLVVRNITASGTPGYNRLLRLLCDTTVRPLIHMETQECTTVHRVQTGGFAKSRGLTGRNGSERRKMGG